MIEIETERLILKKPKFDDKKRLIDLIGDYRVSETLSNVPHPYRDDDAEYWLKRVNNDEFNFSIFLHGSLIGGIGMSPKDNGFFDLGYWLGVEYWGQGYATEAVRSLLDYAKTKILDEIIRACVFTGNTASSKVLEKVGFTTIGAGEVFSLSKQENIPCINYEYYS